MLKVTLVGLEAAGVALSDLRDDHMQLYSRANTLHSDVACAGAGASPLRLDLTAVAGSDQLTCASCLRVPPVAELAAEVAALAQVAASLEELDKVLARFDATPEPARWALIGRAALLAGTAIHHQQRAGRRTDRLARRLDAVAATLDTRRAGLLATEDDQVLLRRYAAALGRLRSREAPDRQAATLFFATVAAGHDDERAAAVAAGLDSPTGPATTAWCRAFMTNAVKSGPAVTQVVAVSEPLRLRGGTERHADSMLAMVGRWPPSAVRDHHSLHVVPAVVATWVRRAAPVRGGRALGPAASADSPAVYAGALDLWDPSAGGPGATLEGALELARLLA